MEETNNQATSPETPIKQQSNQKPNKTIIWLLSVIAVIAVVTAIIFAFLYFSNRSPQNPTQPEATSDSDIDTPSDVDIPTEEETEITDTYIIRDLDEKTTTLLGVTANTNPIRIRGYYTEDIDLFKNGDLSEPARLGRVITPLVQRGLTTEEIDAIVLQEQYSEQDAAYYKKEEPKGIDGKDVRAKYKDTFGVDPTPGLAAEDQCGGYSYNAQNDVYFKGLIYGCGGTNPQTRYYYINNHTITGDKAYVYISTAISSPENTDTGEKVYCDVISLEGSEIENAKVCATISDSDSFTLDETNYKDYSNYRFVFNKANDGTYYFEKVEKVK